MTTTIKELDHRIHMVQQAYTMELGKKMQLENHISLLEEKIGATQESIVFLEHVKQVLLEAGRDARIKAKEKIEEVVTTALQYVFGPEFHFVIDIKETARGVTLDFGVESLQEGEWIRNDPLESRGGGVVDLISIALQLAIVQLYHDPVIQGPIILDEPGKHVSEDYAVKLGLFLHTMAHQLNRQIICITHQPHLAQIADRTYQITLVRGTSKAHVFESASSE